MVSKLGQKIIEKKAVIGVIGLGYIGLSLLDAFGRAGFSLVGYDYNDERMKQLQKKEGYLNFIDHSELFRLFDKKKFKPSSNPDVLKNADILIICVSTSLDRYGTPNLSNLRAAFHTVEKYQKKDQLIILQSSTYPGTTDEELLPILQKKHWKVGKDFFLGHVPEIADIGNNDFNFTQIPHIVSGITSECLEMVALTYETAGCKIFRATSTQVAESAKLLQNAFRLVNISFINEMKIMFDRMNIDVWDVIKTAASKPFGFMPFYPSPGIGGDCIPIAPFYLVWKAKSVHGQATMLDQAGLINDTMPLYVIQKLIEGLNLRRKSIREAKILILGVGYKNDVNDVRESAALKIIPLLKNMLADVHYNDPYVPEISHFPEQAGLRMKSVPLDYNKMKDYDGVVIITNHSCYDWDCVLKNSNLIIDTRNVIKIRKDTKKKVIKA